MARPRSTAFEIYGLPLLWVGASVMTIVAFWAALHATLIDFTIFRDSAIAWREGRNPYLDRQLVPNVRGYNLNPPATLLLFYPLSHLQPPWDVAGWMAFSLICLLIASAVIANAVAPGRAILIACSILITQAGYTALGQFGFLSMLLVALAWRADRGGRLVQAGFWLGIAIYMKLFLAVLLPLFLIRRSWRTLVAIGVTMISITLSSGVFMGWSLYRWWFQVLGSVGVEANVLNASITGALTRNPPASALLWPWVAVFGAVAAVAVLVMFFSKDDDRRWAVALVGGLLLSPLGWVYYLPLVAAPVVALAMRSIVFRCCLILTLLAFAVPFQLLAAYPPTSRHAAIVYSLYTVALMFLFVSVILVPVSPRAVWARIQSANPAAG